MLKLKLKTKNTVSEKQFKNPYIEEVKKMAKEHIIELWKIGFISLKNKNLVAENILKYKALKIILTTKFCIDLPKDNLKD